MGAVPVDAIAGLTRRPMFYEIHGGCGLVRGTLRDFNMRRRDFVSAMFGGAALLPPFAGAQVRPRAPRGWLYSTAAGNGGLREVMTGRWTEITPDGKLFGFDQVSENSRYVELYDSGRGFWLRIHSAYAELRQEPATVWGRIYDGRWASWGELPPLPDYQIRLTYFVPTDRSPAANFQAKIRVIMPFVTELYRQSLQGHGLKAKELVFQSQGQEPLVHLIRGRRTAAYYNGAPDYDTIQQYQRLVAEIPAEVGNSNKHLIMMFAETYEDGPSKQEWLGSIGRGARLSASGGVGIVSAWVLQDMFCATSLEQQMDLLFDDTPIKGRVALGGGQRPDSPRSQFIQDGFGAFAHELGHALGLQHDHRRDQSEIMGQGFRGMRWNFMDPPQPEKGASFSDENMRFLMTSRYLGTDLDVADDIPPKVSIRIVRTQLDKLPASVTVAVDASDDRGLRAIVFFAIHQDTVVGGRALGGKTQSFTQELEITAPKSGRVQIEAHVSDSGGNLTRAVATA